MSEIDAELSKVLGAVLEAALAISKYDLVWAMQRMKEVLGKNSAEALRLLEAAMPLWEYMKSSESQG